jgi:hypothetical protein
MDGLVEKASTKAQSIWETEDAQLTAEFEQREAAFRSQVEERARTLGLKIDQNFEVAMPDAWANAFRLALYEAPQAVQTGKEREWLEQLLADWHQFAGTWDERRNAIGEKAQEVQRMAGEQIEALRLRLVELIRRIEDAQVEVDPLRLELEDRMKEQQSAQEQATVVSGPDLQQAMDVPTKGIQHRVPVSAAGIISMKRLDRDERFPPGSYWLWVRAIGSNGDELWALVPFDLKTYHETRVSIKPGAFFSVKEYLGLRARGR